ncbi:hypothetical protein B0H63DRAFT_192709 [Podospora didyma]|uniref:Ubiquitin-like domain-containing protein n=1 Tax=Podospora didyma TaxID=330526 RepID=A0AAE0NR50_9PEZI|nr:hypothetical protein B0H63DRAFT_192709 [Podospora didyma]
MSAGFGFSAGDFIAALNLVGTVASALRDTCDASGQFAELVAHLDILEKALIEVNNLDLDDEQIAEKIALQQAAAQCQLTIDKFWKKIQKYQPHLRSGGGSTSGRSQFGRGSRNAIKDGWMRIKWTVCKAEDVDKFKADLRGHTSSMQVLLLMTQMSERSSPLYHFKPTESLANDPIHCLGKSASLRDKKQDGQRKTLAGRIQQTSFTWMNQLASIASSVSSCLQQGRELLEITANVMKMNIQIFQAILNLQHHLTRIPAQVERQQPVYMIDALGRESPFHLEFIRSADAFLAVLRANFVQAGVGTDKIDH